MTIKSFTPYLPLTKDCSFDCIYCSEKRSGCWKSCNNEEIICSEKEYLYKVEKYLERNKVLLSLSGLNLTDNVYLTKKIIDLREKYKGNIVESILYTNGNNLEELEDYILEKNIKIELSYSSFLGLERLNINRPRLNYSFNIKNIKNKNHININSIISSYIINNVNKLSEYTNRACEFKNIVFRKLCDKRRDKKTNEIFDIILNESKIKKIEEGFYYKKYICDGYILENANYNDMIKTMDMNYNYKNILFPNGELCSSWEYKNNKIQMENH